MEDKDDNKEANVQRKVGDNEFLDDDVVFGQGEDDEEESVQKLLYESFKSHLILILPPSWTSKATKRKAESELIALPVKRGPGRPKKEKQGTTKTPNTRSPPKTTLKKGGK